MRRLRTRQFKWTVGALAVLGALLNVWVLTIHITSVALTQLHVGGSDIVICQKGGLKYVVGLGAPGEKTAPGKNCPICSGLAALNISIVSDTSLQIAPIARNVTDEISETRDELVADHSPQQILNRGPPLLV